MEKQLPSKDSGPRGSGFDLPPLWSGSGRKAQGTGKKHLDETDFLPFALRLVP